MFIAMLQLIACDYYILDLPNPLYEKEYLTSSWTDVDDKMLMIELSLLCILILRNYLYACMKLLDALYCCLPSLVYFSGTQTLRAIKKLVLEHILLYHHLVHDLFNEWVLYFEYQIFHFNHYANKLKHTHGVDTLKGLLTNFEWITYFSSLKKRNIFYRRSISIK